REVPFLRVAAVAITLAGRESRTCTWRGSSCRAIGGIQASAGLRGVGATGGSPDRNSCRVLRKNPTRWHRAGLVVTIAAGYYVPHARQNQKRGRQTSGTYFCG